MSQDDFKKYTVKVGEGSGCLFQPMTDKYTYILTAKHLFEKKEDDDRGNKKYIPTPDGTNIPIKKQILNGNFWTNELISFTLIKGETYFPHKEADIAILRIEPQFGFDNIHVQDSFDEEKDIHLCGFPHIFATETENYTSHRIEDFIASGNYCHHAKLFGGHNQETIEGMSGGGLLKIGENGIYIIGVQSKMASSDLPMGQIGFVPMRYAKEIVDYPEYASCNLAELLPKFIKNFEFLINDTFLFEVDSIDESRIEGARVTLLNKADEIVNSDITPACIKKMFEKRLLIDDKDSPCITNKAIWIAWLEFLTIIKIAKGDDEKIDKSKLNKLFDTFRLKYANIDDWTKIRKEIGLSDYKGLLHGSTVFISTKKTPKRTFKFPQGTLIDISKPYDKKGFRTDTGINPFTSFNFVHLDYFKEECIVKNIDEYATMSEKDIITKLQQKYNEIFG